MPNLETLSNQWNHVVTEILTLGPMRSGSVCSQNQTYRATDGSLRNHGPYPLLTFKEKGKTRTVRLESQEQAEICGKQIESFRKFQELTKELVEIGRQMADAQIVDQTQGKKNFSNRSKSSARRKRPGSCKR
jgi:hypothetical protein